MNQSIRCQARDVNGHQCNRKAGHEAIKPTPERPKDVRPHSAFGREWGAYAQ
jgi:hypothetical protein